MDYNIYDIFYNILQYMTTERESCIMYYELHEVYLFINDKYVMQYINSY
jgi:hypothetical protein